LHAHLFQLLFQFGDQFAQLDILDLQFRWVERPFFPEASIRGGVQVGVGQPTLFRQGVPRHILDRCIPDGGLAPIPFHVLVWERSGHGADLVCSSSTFAAGGDGAATAVPMRRTRIETIVRNSARMRGKKNGPQTSYTDSVRGLARPEEKRLNHRDTENTEKRK